MRPRRNRLALALVLAVAALAAACEKATIGKILDNPDRYYGKEVGVQGTVEDSYSVPLLGGAYKIDDGTGELWVVSKRGSTPRRGARVGAKGRVYNGLTFGGRNFGTVLEESDRRTR